MKNKNIRKALLRSWAISSLVRQIDSTILWKMADDNSHFIEKLAKKENIDLYKLRDNTITPRLHYCSKNEEDDPCQL